MTQTTLPRFLFPALLLFCVAAFAAPPNYIVIFCDDLGYGDLGCYGSTRNRTPHIDGLARDGMMFSDFYVSSPVCTPSRASLLTGSYARRVGMHEDYTEHWVLIPRSRRGLNSGEVTLPEMLKDAGYATTCIGKWHLGDQPEHLPTRHGFDSYYGIPYSNDMASAKRGDPPLPIVRDEKVIEAPCDQSTLTKRYTAEAITFIEANRGKPFFLYLPHTFPHLPLFASPDFKGKSANGRYGDSVEEIDWSTGEILKCLDRLKLAENTVVIFTSDNGSNGRNGGSNLPLAGSKGGTMEGGMRVPMIVRWPGKVPKGSKCSELATTMDFLPTFAALSKAKLPAQKMDGYDISDLLMAKAGAKSPYDAFYYYRRRQLQAIRWGKWKWHLPLEQRFKQWSSIKGDGKPVKGRLINLETDLKESTDVSARYPEVMAKMKELADKAVADLGNEEKAGAGQRPALTLDSGKPLVLEK
jgi:arylsulfatase A-like enzyme